MIAELVSKNPHKLRELSLLLPGWRLEATRAEELPEEVGATFLENARAKARFGQTVSRPGRWTIGEDSGLEVDALGGRPGILSARFSGPGASDEENVVRLLAELERLAGSDRRARYVCELVCLSPDGREARARGTLSGRIAERPRGSGGFGYDPVFVPEGETRTVAELGDGWKTLHSHRAAAARELAVTLGTTAPER
ncbi:MAG TPA: non-canonical purine NTP pyrophosphatase [Gaiellaceae bacterium]|nr:non-canonical purine NTP pyrophosphatase [Gaiellaceae bacterium]